MRFLFNRRLAVAQILHHAGFNSNKFYNVEIADSIDDEDGHITKDLLASITDVTAYPDPCLALADAQSKSTRKFDTSRVFSF